MQPYRVVFQPTAFRRLLALSPDERSEAIRAIDELRANPTPDERRKHAFAVRSDVVFWLYDGTSSGSRHRVVDFEVSILTIVPRRAQQ